tara:strand:- start:299 stop:898 length:600 start_codon:yes stop_codon:yes gene_type:complete
MPAAGISGAVMKETHMAKNVTDADDGGSADVHGNVSHDTFLQAISEITNAQALVDEAKAGLKKVRKKFKSEGIELGLLDEAIKEADWTRNESRSKEQTRARYRNWLNLPVGAQPDMFEPADTSDPEVSETEWEARGVTAGLLGRDHEPPTECPPEHHQAFLRGRLTGQTRLAESMPGAKKAAAKAKPSKAQTAKEPEPA